MEQEGSARFMLLPTSRRTLKRRSVIMKKQLLVASVFAIGLQGAAFAAYPTTEQSNTFPSAGEESYAMPAPTKFESWGVSKRIVQPGSPFPSGGGYIDD